LGCLGDEFFSGDRSLGDRIFYFSCFSLVFIRFPLRDA